MTVAVGAEVGLPDGEDVGGTTGERVGLGEVGLRVGRGEVFDPLPCKLEYPLTGLLVVGGLVGRSVGANVGTLVPI